MLADVASFGTSVLLCVEKLNTHENVAAGRESNCTNLVYFLLLSTLLAFLFKYATGVLALN